MGQQSTRYPAEVREQVCLVLDQQADHASQWEAIGPIAALAASATTSPPRT